jgi:hypothetical protein
MLFKAAIFAVTVTVAAATQPLLAAPPEAAAPQPAAKPVVAKQMPSAKPAPHALAGGKALVLKPGQAAPTDVTAGRGPNPHASELNAIAVYRSVGNRVDAEILANELAQFGIKRRTIRQSLDWAQIHDRSPDHDVPTASINERHAEMGLGATQ